MKYNYNKKLKTFSRDLRKYGTKAEALLWLNVLKAKKTGYQFNRQYAVNNFIVDFICRKLNLIIEIDGGSHLLKGSEDYEKQKELEKLGYNILRFSEAEVVVRMDIVIEKIEYAIYSIECELNNETNPPPSHFPSHPPFSKGD